MVTIKYLSRNSAIFTVMLILLLPLQCLKATTIEFGTNLIENGTAELGVGSTGGYDVLDVPEWDTVGNFTVVNYGAGSGSSKFPDFDSPGPDDRGINFFAGGPGNATSSAVQIIDVSGAAYEIDQGTVGYDLSGYFGGWEGQNDNAVLTVLFQDNNGNVLGSDAIGSISASDRGNDTSLLYRDTQGFLPTDTRQIEVLLVMNRTDGSYNDGYADNLSFVLVPLPSTFILLGTGILAMRRYQRISRRPRHSQVGKSG